ncbi:MAG: hypothetical protein JSR31_00085 [Nitrospira sp.]|nr:hypothetical protein [Nitrospira sp.]
MIWSWLYVPIFSHEVNRDMRFGYLCRSQQLPTCSLNDVDFLKKFLQET